MSKRKQFSLPPNGSVVRVVTRYPDYYYQAPKKYIEHVTEGVVVPPSADIPDSFGVKVPNQTHVPVISLNHVHNLIVDGQKGQKIQSRELTSYQVPGSKGNVYTVVVSGKEISCTCPGFHFRRYCKHVKAAADGELK